MSDDLVKRLRETTYMYQVDCELKMKCADRIEALEAENAELKAKLAWAMEGLPQMKSDLENRDYNSAYLICKHILEHLTGGKDE